MAPRTLATPRPEILVFGWGARERLRGSLLDLYRRSELEAVTLPAKPGDLGRPQRRVLHDPPNLETLGGTKSHYFSHRVTKAVILDRAAGKVAKYIASQAGSGEHADLRSAKPLQAGSETLRRCVEIVRQDLTAVLEHCSEDHVDEDETIVLVANAVAEDFRWARQQSRLAPAVTTYSLPLLGEVSYSSVRIFWLCAILVLVVAVFTTYVMPPAPAGAALTLVGRYHRSSHALAATLGHRVDAPPVVMIGGVRVEGDPPWIPFDVMFTILVIASVLAAAKGVRVGVPRLASAMARGWQRAMRVNFSIGQIVGFLSLALFVHVGSRMNLPQTGASSSPLGQLGYMNARVATLGASNPAAAFRGQQQLGRRMLTNHNVAQVFMLGDADALEIARAYDLVPAKRKKSPGGAQALNIFDTGACIDVFCDDQYEVPGSRKPNLISVDTANGTVTPPYSIDADVPMPLEGGGVKLVRREGGLLMETCKHNLISGGKLCNEGCGIWLGPWNTSSYDSSYIQFPSGERATLHNNGVIVIPSSGKAHALGGVTSGASSKDRHLSSRGIHNRFNHRPAATLRKLPDCTTDAPASWRSLSMEPCESCLEANSDKLSSTKHVPPRDEPGHFSFDTYSIGVNHVHGGHPYVFGAHDTYSTLTWIRLMKHKSEAGEALKELDIFCKKHGVSLKSLHADNATEFVGKNTALQKYIESDLKIPMTTCAAYEPRGNGMMERQWRTMGRDCRGALNCSDLPRNYAGWALTHVNAVSWMLPIPGTNETPWSRFTGSKPDCMDVRPFGCLCYPKIHHPITKQSNQSMPCIHLTKSQLQPGYVCLEPLTGKIYVTPHVRFVESEFPGLERTEEGYDRVAPPSFSIEADTRMARAERCESAPIKPTPQKQAVVSDLLDDEPLPSLLDDDDSDDGEPNDERAGDDAVGTEPEALRGAPDRPISQRLSRSNRGPRGANVACSADLATPAEPFVLYLFSGEAREGDLEKQLGDLANLTTVCVDVCRGGYDHHVLQPHVDRRIQELASDSMCVFVMATPPCNTFSALRFKRPGPAVLRDLDSPLGLLDAKGNRPAEAETANQMVTVMCNAIRAADKHGAGWCVENPVSRASGSPCALGTQRQREARRPLGSPGDAAPRPRPARRVRLLRPVPTWRAHAKDDGFPRLRRSLLQLQEELLATRLRSPARTRCDVGDP